MDFEDIVRPYISILFRIAYTYVKDSHAAEDIVQDVLIKAYERQTQFRGEANYETYLVKMTINRSYDYLRSWHYRQLVLTNKWSDLLNHSHTPENSLLTKEQNITVAELILRLQPKYREVLFFYYYLQYDVNEIAMLLKLSVNTVKTRLVRARKMLKNLTTKLEVDFNETEFN